VHSLLLLQLGRDLPPLVLQVRNLIPIRLSLVLKQSNVTVKLQSVFVAQGLSLLAVVLIYEVQQTDIGRKDPG
jgi:hypothetical protein